MNLEKAKLHIGEGKIQEALDVLETIEGGDEIIQFRSQYSRIIQEDIAGTISTTERETLVNQITKGILTLIKEIEKRNSSARVISKPYYLQFNPKSRKWDRIEVDQQGEPHATPLNSSNEIIVLGLPKTGKTTKLKNTLSNYAHLSPGIYIPFSGLDINYLEVVQSAPTNIRGGKHIIAFDDFDSVDFLNEAKELNLTTIVSPKNISLFKNDIYLETGKEYLTPLDFNSSIQILKNLQEKNDYFLPIPLCSMIVKSSGGIAALIEALYYYFESNKKLPDRDAPQLWLQNINLFEKFEKEASSVLSLDDKVNLLFYSLTALGKPIADFHRITEQVMTEEAILLKKLGIDSITSSSLLRRLFLFDKKNSNDGVEFINKYLKNVGFQAPYIWTPDLDLRRIKEGTKIFEYISQLLKQDKKLLSRVDWQHVKVDGTTKPPEYDLKSGEKVSFEFGKRENYNSFQANTEMFNSIKPYRSIQDKINRKAQRKLIARGDIESRSKNFELAETYYNEALRIVTDSKWGKVRLANLYRVSGELEKSIDICSKIIRSTPNPYAYQCLGICYFWQGLFDEASKCFDRAIELRKTPYINALIWNIRSNFHLNRDDAASKAYENLKAFRKEKPQKPSFPEEILLWILLFRNAYYESFDRKTEKILILAKEESGDLSSSSNEFNFMLGHLIQFHYRQKSAPLDNNPAKQIGKLNHTIHSDLFHWNEILPTKNKERSNFSLFLRWLNLAR